MHPVIKEILDKNTSTAEKAQDIADIKNSIEIAERIFSGEFCYCKKCGDYYFSKSFFVDTEIVDENVCTYCDPINSSGDEYEKRKVRYTYKYCPKGCKHEINREELWL